MVITTPFGAVVASESQVLELIDVIDEARYWNEECGTVKRVVELWELAQKIKSQLSITR